MRINKSRLRRCPSSAANFVDEQFPEGRILESMGSLILLISIGRAKNYICLTDARFFLIKRKKFTPITNLKNIFKRTVYAPTQLYLFYSTHYFFLFFDFFPLFLNFSFLVVFMFKKVSTPSVFPNHIEWYVCNSPTTWTIKAF